MELGERWMLGESQANFVPPEARKLVLDLPQFLSHGLLIKAGVGLCWSFIFDLY